MQEMNILRPARHWSHSLDFSRLLGAMRSLVAFALLMAISRATLAQIPAAEPRPASTVSGTVRNSDGNPVADASVFFDEKGTTASVETKTKVDGTFSFLALRPGTYTVRAEKTGMRVAAPASLLLSMGEKKQIDLILESAPANPSKDAKEPAAASAMEFDDKPSFTVAGVTDWTNVGGHGSDTKLRTSESLAKETATLESSDSGRTSADAARDLCAAADLRPTDPSAYLFLGKMEKAAPEPLPCAAEKLARFARDQPANALANYYFAVSIWKCGQRSGNPQYLRRTELLLQKALAADPKLDPAYVQLGMVYAARANFARAIEIYKKAAEIKPQSSEAHYRLALAYKRVGEEEKSGRELKLYKEADQTETAAFEQQRREIRQFLIILKDQPAGSQPQ